MLKSLLWRIANIKIKTLESNFNDVLENAEETEKIWSTYCTYKDVVRNARDCFEQYKKVTKYIE